MNELDRFYESLKILSYFGTTRICNIKEHKIFESVFPKAQTRTLHMDFIYDAPEVVYFDIMLKENNVNTFINKLESFKNNKINYKPKIVYHKTKPNGEKGINNFLSIINNNFDKKFIRTYSPLCFGRGFYFTTNCLVEDKELYNETYIVCLVLEGNKYIYNTAEMNSYDNGPCKPNFHSHYGNGKFGKDELVIFDELQILPLGLAHTNGKNMNDF